MRDHLGSCVLAKRAKGKRAKEFDDDEGLSIHSPASPQVRQAIESIERPTMTNQLLAEKVLRMIVAGNLPFAQAENPEFVALLKHAYPSLNPPSRRTTRDLLGKRAQDAKADLRDRFAKLDSKVSLALDAWRSRGNVEFLGIVVGPVM